MKTEMFTGFDWPLFVPPRLDVRQAGEHQVVHVGSTPIAAYPIADVTARRHVIVQLAEAGAVRGVGLAAAFDVTPIYVSRLRTQYREQGSAGLQAGRRGPHGPMKVTPAIEARVRRLAGEGLSTRAIASRLEASGKKISYQTVRRILQRDQVEQEILPTIEEPKVEESAAAVSGLGEAERAGGLPEGVTRYAGAMLLHVALEQLGLWRVLAQVGARLDRSRMAAAQVVGMIALGFALRLRSIERFKTAFRRDFGLLLGLPRVPSVQTLRRQVGELAEGVEPEAVMRQLLEAVVALEPVWEGAYYIDGHFCSYSGKHPLPKGWNARRRLVEPGQTDVYVHDAAGRALFFINRPLNDSLSKVMPKVVKEIQAVAGEQTVVLLFDRGGYSGSLFRELTAAGIGFITYLKGRKAKRRFPPGRFERRWTVDVDPAGIKATKRTVYRIYEKGTRVGGAGTLRTLVWEDQGVQIPVLTNCAEMPAAKAVHLLTMRWRQENSFKYLSEHFGVEQLIQYEAEYRNDERLMENPKRADLRGRIQSVRDQIVVKEAELGQAVESSRTNGHRTTAGLKRAHVALRREIDGLKKQLDRLENRLSQMPTKVPRKEVSGQGYQAFQRTDRRNLVNAIKIATYNAERLLARRFFRHYQDPRDWLTMFRSFFHLPGRLTHDEDSLRVELRAPDRPTVRLALESTIQEINKMNARLFGAGPRLVFALEN